MGCPTYESGTCCIAQNQVFTVNIFGRRSFICQSCRHMFVSFHQLLLWSCSHGVCFASLLAPPILGSSLFRRQVEPEYLRGARNREAGGRVIRINPCQFYLGFGFSIQRVLIICAPLRDERPTTCAESVALQNKTTQHCFGKPSSITSNMGVSANSHILTCQRHAAANKKWQPPGSWTRSLESQRRSPPIKQGYSYREEAWVVLVYGSWMSGCC